MKIKAFILASFATLLLSCAEDVERQALPYLERARQAYVHKKYHLARLQIDSVAILYPKAFDVRRQAQRLSLQVDLADAHDSMAYTDSLLQEVQGKLPVCKARLYLDKDTRYQDVGVYYAAGHRLERNAGRTYLRPQVDEQGKHSIVVFHRGKPVGGNLLRITASDGTYVEVPAVDEAHVSSDVSGKTERVDFVPGRVDMVGSFVKLHGGKRLKAELVGSKGKVTVPFAAAEVKAFAEVCELTALLGAANQLQMQRQELSRRMQFYETRLQADSVETDVSR